MMSNLFFLLCWWVGVFTRPEPLSAHSMTGTLTFAKIFEPPVARIEFTGWFILCDNSGREIVVVNTKTGKVKLRGNPNEAARQFWKAVETMHPGQLKQPVLDEAEMPGGK